MAMKDKVSGRKVSEFKYTLFKAKFGIKAKAGFNFY
jgi:hypothetical protein